MNISIIAAMSQNRVIGKDNALPWYLPEDLKRFKSITLHKPIIMGRKTFVSLGRPLPQRENIVITRNPQFQASGCHIVHSLDEAIAHARTFNTTQHLDEIMIIGGAEIFSQALQFTKFLYFTVIDQRFDGDSFFPEIDHSQWTKTFEELHTATDSNGSPIFNYRYLNFENAVDSNSLIIP